MFATTNAVVNQAFASSGQQSGRARSLHTLNRTNSCSHQTSLSEVQHARQHKQSNNSHGHHQTESSPLTAALLNPAANVSIHLGAGTDNVLSPTIRVSNQALSACSPRELQYLAEIADESQEPSDLVHQRSFRRSDAGLRTEDREERPERDDKSVTQEDEQRYLLRINVGGQSFTLLNRYVERHGPHSLLGRLLSYTHSQRLRLCHLYIKHTNEYFFHRNPLMFQSIYEFYVTGTVHVPDGVCLKKYLAEMHFWGVPYDKIASCCSPVSDIENDNEEKESEADDQEHLAQLFDGKCCANIRMKMWRITEGMDSGRAWKVYEFLSTGFVLASILGLIIGSLPQLQVTRDAAFVKRNASDRDPLIHYPTGLDQVEHPIFTYVEYMCVAYFAADYCVRLIIAPARRAFVVAPLNAIDLLVIAPCILELIFELYGLNSEHFRQVRWTIVTVRVLRVLRVLRIAKLGRFSVGLRNFALTMKRSKSHLEMVAVIMITAIIFFSTLEYFLEKDQPNTEFTSIPSAFWWCIVTMSTVGYGDAVPETAGGKLVASATIVCGMMVLAIPITITVNNFMQVSRMNHASLYTLAHEADSKPNTGGGGGSGGAPGPPSMSTQNSVKGGAQLGTAASLRSNHALNVLNHV